MAKNPPSQRPKSSGPSRTAARPGTKPPTGRPAGLFTWVAIGLVVVVVAALVIIKVTTTSNGATSNAFQPTSATVAQEVTSVPASVFNAVGVTSTAVPVSPPIPLSKQPALVDSATGKPELFYLGAEYCPFCAAERWPLILALSRFGTFKNLGDMESSTKTGEVYPGTPTFTFVKSTYTSPYLSFKSIEQFTNVWDNATNYYTPLQTPSKPEEAVFQKYDTSKYIPGITSAQDGSIPFITIGNQYLVAGASYTPQLLAGISRETIAGGLSNATNPVTVAIVATANYLTASICSITKDHPGSVCSSKGVAAAKKVLGIK